MMKKLLIGFALVTSIFGATAAQAAWSAVGSPVTKTCVGAFDTCTIDVTVTTAGDLIQISGGLWQSGGIASYTVTGGGATFSYFLGPNLGTGYKPFIAYAVAVTTGSVTFTVNGANADDWGSFSYHEFAVSAGNTWALDVDGVGATGTSTTPADSLTTLTANALILGVMTKNASATMTPTANYTEIGEEPSGTNLAHNAVYRIATTATSYTVDWTMNNSVGWTVYTAAFKEIVSAGACALPLLGVGEC
jgi:hypothetical protein